MKTRGVDVPRVVPVDLVDRLCLRRLDPDVKKANAASNHVSLLLVSLVVVSSAANVVRNENLSARQVKTTRCVHTSRLNHLGTPSSSVVQLLSHHRHDALPSLHLNKQATLAF